MKHVARENKSPLVDMTNIDQEFQEELGEETYHKMHIRTNRRHGDTGATGAACYAALVAQN